jgi:hypothetical protein
MPDDPAPPTGEIVLYQTEDGRTRVECRFVDETLWLSQALIGELFQKDVRTVNEHLQNIYQEGEIEEQATIRKFRIVRREGPREVERDIEHYNLDAILAVGYRVRSELGDPCPSDGIRNPLVDNSHSIEMRVIRWGGIEASWITCLGVVRPHRSGRR